MTGEDVMIWAKAILIKISVVTGWELPQLEAYDILSEQFAKKMVESYASVNPDEIEYAFITVKTQDWGKPINLYLIDDVMQEYLSQRVVVSRIEEQQKLKKMLPEAKEDMSNEGMDKLFDDTEMLVEKGAYSIELIPPMLYDWMDKNGNILLTRDDKHKYIERATLYRHGMIATAYEHNPNSLETKANLAEFNKMRASKTYSEIEHKRIKELAKKMVLFDMMKAKVSKQL